MREFEDIFSLEAMDGQGASILQDAMEKIAHGFAVWDADLNIVMYSRKFLELWQMDEGYVRRNPNLRTMLRDMLLRTGQATTETVDEVVARRLKLGLEGFAEDLTQLIGPAGRWIEYHACRTEAGRWVITYTDVSDKKGAEEELIRRATQDALTGLLNRFQFFKLSSLEVEKARRLNASVPVMLFDLDHFKAVNDTHGHAAGDAALVAAAQAAASSMRPYDIVGRVGGEEFAALLPNLDLEGALAVAERLRVNVAAAPVKDNPDIRLSISIGISMTRADEKSVEPALSRADAALYDAKRSGRDCIRHREKT